jgi:undecaprenyl-diphosphatase
MPAITTRIHWPALSRRLLVAAGVFLAAFMLVALLVHLNKFGHLDHRLTQYMQNRGSLGQDISLGIFSYLGSIEVTIGLALVLAVPLFRGLRLLALGPTAVVLLSGALEYLGKHSIHQVPPGAKLLHFPSFLPKLPGRLLDPYSFPSGHMLRTTLVFGLILYLAERWELFGKDASRLSPVLVWVIFLMGYAVVYLGWHWLSDALGGALLGMTLLLGMIAYLERKRLVHS